MEVNLNYLKVKPRFLFEEIGLQRRLLLGFVLPEQYAVFNDWWSLQSLLMTGMV